MSDLKIIGNNAAATTNEPVNVQITPGKRTYTKSRSAVSTKEAETYEAAEDLLKPRLIMRLQMSSLEKKVLRKMPLKAANMMSL